jgi:hypothetical protein
MVANHTMPSDATAMHPEVIAMTAVSDAGTAIGVGTGCPDPHSHGWPDASIAHDRVPPAATAIALGMTLTRTGVVRVIVVRSPS